MKNNKEILKDFIKEVWNEKKIDKIPEYIDESYVANTLGKGGRLKGFKGVKNNVINCHKNFKDFKIIINRIIQEDDLISSWITLQKKNKIMNELIIHKFKRGKIIEAWSIGGDWLNK